jgi:cyclase
MRRVGPHSFTEIYFAGCNPSFVETSDGYVMIDTPQQPIDAVRWREMMEEKAPIRYLINTEPHGDHISGNAYFPNVPVVGQVKLQECFQSYLNAFGTMDEKRERLKQSDPDSVFLLGHPDYADPHGPTVTFIDGLTLNVGNHTFQIIHHPGHTAPQTSVYVPEEGVVFTGDNVFHKCRSWLQECDPWEWLDALNKIDSPRSSFPATASNAARRISRSRRRSSRTGWAMSNALSIAASARGKSCATRSP